MTPLKRHKMGGDVAGFAGATAGRKSSLLRNGLYNIGGQAVRGAVAVVTIPCLIRFLGIREYGVWSLAYAVLALMIMSEAGISVAVTVFLSKDLAEEALAEANRTLSFISLSAIGLSLMLGGILWFGGSQIVRPLSAFGPTERADAGRALQIAGFAVSVMILQRTLIGIEQAFDRYAIINVLDLSQSLLANIGIVLVAWFGGRTVAMMKWQVLACTVILAGHGVVVYHLLRGKGLRFAWNAKKSVRILRYGIATWTSTLGSVAFGQCDRLIVGVVLGPPLLGIYSAITGLTSKINSFSGTAVQPLVPSLSRDAMSVSREGRIRQAVQLNALIAAESGIVLYVLADWIMRVMIPGAMEPSSILALQITALIYAVYSLNAPGHFILFAVGQPRINALVTLSSTVLSLVLIFLGARHFGLLGALTGNAGYLFSLLLVSYGLKKVRVALPHYLGWVAFPILGLLAALIGELVLHDYFWWRVVFIAVQGAAFSFWFLRSHGDNSWFRFSFGRISAS